MRNWDSAIIGIDKKNDIIVIKECSAEVYGSVKVCVPSFNGNQHKCEEKKAIAKAKNDNTRNINIGHLIRSGKLMADKLQTNHFHAERDGDMIFLKEMSLYLDEQENE